MILLAGFTLCWVLVLYLLNSAFAGSLKRINSKQAALYISAVILIGVFGEVFVGTLYHAVFGFPLWEYRIFPIHSGYTSLYAPFIWGMYGFHLYLLHGSLSDRGIKRTRYFAAIISIEAIVVEFFFNLSHLLLFGEYIFYYFPDGFWHLTAIQAVPIYFLAGMAFVQTIRRFSISPWFFTAMSIMLAGTMILLG